MTQENTAGMTLREADGFRNMLDKYFDDRHKRASGGAVKDGVTSRTLMAYVDTLLAEKDKEIAALKAQSTLINRLWASSTGLLDRFNAQPSVKQAADRMMSEVLELVIAAHDTYGASTDDAAEEAADVVVTAINVLRAACVTQEQFTAALETIIAKNDKKSHDDYELIVKTQGVEKRAAKVKS